MQTEQNATAEDVQIFALDILASMAYQTKFNVECLDGKVMKLKPSPFRDVVMLFVENQKSWINKLMRGMKKIGIDKAMEQDLSSADLANYSIVCEFARQTKDLAGAANLMEYISAADSIPTDVEDQIISIIKPLIKSK
jgi:hypothetical protein